MNQYFSHFYCQIIFYCMDMPHLFIYSSVGRHLDCFHFLAVMNNWDFIMLWTFVYKFLLDICFHFSWYIPRSWNAKSYGNSMFRETFSGTASLFPKVECIIIHSNQQRMRVPIFTPLPISATICLLKKFSHLGVYEVVSHCDLDLYFSTD